MGDYGPLEQIKRKCEQYWNENHIGATEVHAILEFIHVRSDEVKAEVERLQDLVDNNESYRQECIESMDRKRAEVERLEGGIRELFDAMTAGGGNRDRTSENNERLVAAWAALRDMNAAAKEQADG